MKHKTPCMLKEGEKTDWKQPNLLEICSTCSGVSLAENPLAADL